MICNGLIIAISLLFLFVGLFSKDSEKIQKAAEDNSSAAPHFFTLQFLFYSIRTNVQGFMVN